MEPHAADKATSSIRVQVQTVHLVNSSATFDLSQHTGDGSLDYNLDVKVWPTRLSDDSGFTVSVYNDLTIVENSASDSSVVRQVGNAKATFELSMQVHPEDTDRVTDREVNQFANDTGIKTAYPYVRQYLTDLLGRAGIPPLFVPLVEHTAPDGAPPRQDGHKVEKP